MYRGQLKTWNGDKNFGFIHSEELNQETFFHISTLKVIGRDPKQGDFISFEIEKLANGKFRAINCHIESISVKSFTKRSSPDNYKSSSTLKRKMVLVLAIVLITVFAYQRLDMPLVSNLTLVTKTEANISLPMKSTIKTRIQSHFTCDGRQHCSQMTSRAEAKFFTRHCPNTKMDGDNDGIPCENDSRF